MKNTRDIPWVEKYRPQQIEDVISDADSIIKFKEIISTKKIPHLLFCGKAGIGKTTVAKIIAKSVTSEVMYINASDERSIDVIRNKVKNFCATVSFSGIKVVILDEFDGMTPQAMEMLRNVMEEYITNCAFILTCNYERKVIVPIKSRCQIFTFTSVNDQQSKINIIKRCYHILKEEGIKAPNVKEDLCKLVGKYYPDIRRTINMMQMMTMNGQFKYQETPDETVTIGNRIIELIKSNDIQTIRKEIMSKNVDYEGLYTVIFERAAEIHPDKVLSIMVIVGEYEYRHSLAINQEIQFITCLITICREISS